MEKFLFTDGTNGVKEVQSREELEELVANSPDPVSIHIWMFSHHEWLSYASFCMQYPAAGKAKSNGPRKGKPFVPETAIPVAAKRPRRQGKRLLVYSVIVAGVFLVFNFTKLKWEKAAPLTVTALRPANVPYMDVDSLIRGIEQTRGQRIDKHTKNNLRLRNTWPDVILLEASADQKVSGNARQFSNISIDVDNTTGLALDKATVLLTVWENGQVNTTDTVQFNAITHNGKITRQFPLKLRGDSIAVAFESIAAKAFNFCYSIHTENQSGNYNDRWFCREN